MLSSSGVSLHSISILPQVNLQHAASCTTLCIVLARTFCSLILATDSDRIKLLNLAMCIILTLNTCDTMCARILCSSTSPWKVHVKHHKRRWYMYICIGSDPGVYLVTCSSNSTGWPMQFQEYQGKC